MRHIGMIAAELRRANPTKATKKAVISYLRATEGMRSKDAESIADQILREAGRQSAVLNARNSRARAVNCKHMLPTGTPEERLRNKIISWSAVPYLMNRSREYTKEFTLTNDSSKVGYTVTIGQEWKKYGRKGWMRSTTDHHAITLPRWFMSRVVKNGLRIVNGIPTLDAKKLDAPNGCELFAARWATQGRGYAVNVEDGYIARSTRNKESFHGKTAKSALKGLEKKIAGSVFNGCTMEQLASAHPDKWVSLSDLKAIGACDPGIQMWVARTGMQAQLKSGGATIKEIAKGYAICPAPEARAAAIHALRNAKTELVMETE